MRLALLEVARGSSSRQGYNEFHFNLALGYLAAAAESRDHNVLMLQQRPGEPDNSLVAKLVEFRPDLVGFTCNTHTYPGTVEFKQKLSLVLSATFIIGGVHATCALEESTNDFDAVVVGEGEETLLAVLEALQEGPHRNNWRNIRGVAYRNLEGRLVKNPPRDRLNNLDQYGPPKRIASLVSLDKQVYPAVPKHPPFAPVSFSRGCRRRCSFCTNGTMYQSQLVTRNPKKIVEEILSLRDEHGVTDFYVHDEDILSDVELTSTVCRMLISSRAGITWMGMASIARVSPELAALMHKAGCVMMAFGLESGADLLRNEFGKPFPSDSAREKIRAVFDSGIVPVGLFVLGTPHETDATLEATFSFAASLHCIRYRFAYLYPYPGTELRDVVDLQSLWLDEEYKRHEYADADIPVVRCGVEHATLAGAQRDFLKRIYTSDSYRSRVQEFVENNPAWQHSILEEWAHVVEQEIGATVAWRGRTHGC